MDKLFIILSQYLKYYLKKDVQMIFAMMFFMLGSYSLYKEREIAAYFSLGMAVILILTRSLTKSYDDCKDVINETDEPR